MFVMECLNGVVDWMAGSKTTIILLLYVLLLSVFVNVMFIGVVKHVKARARRRSNCLRYRRRLRELRRTISRLERHGDLGCTTCNHAI